MMEEIVEVAVAGIILVIGLGIGLILWGVDPEAVTPIISGFTKFAVYALVAAVLISIPASILR